jgi:hypothetical protein
VVVFGVSVGVACGATHTGPSQNDASAPDGPSEMSETGSTDAAASDAPPADARGTSDGAAADGPDATVLMCPAPKFPPWDGSVPDGDICSSPDDTDHDGYPDCIDGCPYDPEKIAPGECGCNVPDVDSDGDGVADCLDECPYDPNHVSPGYCGCAGQLSEPAGTSCLDPPCPQSSPTCSSTGVCGDRSMCVPCPGGHYIESPNGVSYWLCVSLPSVAGPGCAEEDSGSGGPPLTRMAAQSGCAARGLSLARIETPDDNRFIASLIAFPVWLGANDLQTPGDWYFSSSTSDSAFLFWTGGPDGGQQNGGFNDWAAGAPGSASCASMIPGDGHWVDADCSKTLGYICN